MAAFRRRVFRGDVVLVEYATEVRETKVIGGDGSTGGRRASMDDWIKIR